MTNLTLIHKEGDILVHKNIIGIDNWRVIGRDENKLYLITHDCKTYHISDLSIEQFHDTVKKGIALIKEGTFTQVSLACQRCGGTGVTDWISDIVGTKKDRRLTKDALSFKRDPKIPTYKITLNNKTFLNVSSALVPMARKHCSLCKGSGLHFISNLNASDFEV